MTCKSFLPLPLAREGRGEGKPLWVAFVLLLSTLAACGNYSNEDLEYMNAVPARVDIAAVIPRSLILPANEAELSRLTHDVINTFNGALVFLEAADVIRRYQPTSRIPHGRVWGPGQMEEHPDWQWRFRITRDPAAPDVFSYWFEVQLIGGGDVWISFIEGTFVATGGVRRGTGHFHIGTDGLRAGGFPVDINAKGELLKDLDVEYSTAEFPIWVKMHMVLYTDAGLGLFMDKVMIDYRHEAQSNGQGAMEFSGTDSKTGWTLSIVSRWMSTGTGRADARAVNGAGVDMTRTQCWDDSFRQTYDYTPWDQPPDPIEEGNIADCPDISTL
jgi:hypothetical protein